MLHGTLWDKIPRFAIPVAATAILSQLFNAADIAVIGNFTGELRTVAVAAVGTNSSIISLIVNLFIGIALGANVTIAHAIGEKNDTMVHHAVHTSIVVAVLGGLIAAVIGELFAVPLLNQLNVPDDVFPLALLYLRIYLAGLPVILLYNFEAAVFRSVGETKIPLIALTASGVLNVILNLFFVAALHMSVDGVAIATVLSNAVSAAILWVFLLKTDKVIRLEPKKLRIDGLCLKQILRIGVPAGVQSAMFSIANIVIQGAINSLGTVVMAASSAAYNIEVITYDILNSFSQACTTFVGQNFGAGEIKRCKKTLLLCLLEGIISLGVAIALILFFGKSLLTIFNGDPHLRRRTAMKNEEMALLFSEATPYIQKYHGKTMVIKYGGNAMINETLKNAVMNDLVTLTLLGVRVVLVHGGGPAINEMLKKVGVESHFAGGLRVTDDATMEIVQQVLAGKVNKDLVAKLRGRGVGLCGMDGQMLRCTELDPQLGHVGEIVHVDPTLISSLLDSGYIPVIATVGMDDLGQAYNVNADTAAAQIAIALKAEKLVSMTDIAGLLRDKEDESTLIPEVEVSEIEGYKSAGIIAGGMIPKIGGMADAIYQGVHEAVIIDGRVPHSILLELFSDRGSGTRFYRRSHHE